MDERKILVARNTLEKKKRKSRIYSLYEKETLTEEGTRAEEGTLTEERKLTEEGTRTEEGTLVEEETLTEKETQAEKKALNAKKTSTDRAKKNELAYNGPHHIGKCHTILQGFYFIGVYFMNLANHKMRALIFLLTSLVGCCVK